MGEESVLNVKGLFCVIGHAKKVSLYKIKLKFIVLNIICLTKARQKFQLMVYLLLVMCRGWQHGRKRRNTKS